MGWLYKKRVEDGVICRKSLHIAAREKISRFTMVFEVHIKAGKKKKPHSNPIPDALSVSLSISPLLLSQHSPAMDESLFSPGPPSLTAVWSLKVPLHYLSLWCASKNQIQTIALPVSLRSFPEPNPLSTFGHGFSDSTEMQVLVCVDFLITIGML